MHRDSSRVMWVMCTQLSSFLLALWFCLLVQIQWSKFGRQRLENVLPPWLATKQVHTKDVRLDPNGSNLGLFNINFQHWSFNVSDLSHLGLIWPYLGPPLTSMASWVKVLKQELGEDFAYAVTEYIFMAALFMYPCVIKQRSLCCSNWMAIGLFCLECMFIDGNFA